MPVIVIGADTHRGMEIIRSLAQPGREVRAFVSDPEAVSELKSMGVKVAIGDVSDDSHVGAAASECFSAILIISAASDDRERSFADTPELVLKSWGRAVAEAKVRRAIWVGQVEPQPEWTREFAVVDPEMKDLVDHVVALDDARTLNVRDETPG